MTNKEIYMKEINTSKDYKTTFKEFMNWLEKNHKYEEILKEEIKEDIYKAAVDFSIPLIMVKKLKTIMF